MPGGGVRAGQVARWIRALDRRRREHGIVGDALPVARLTAPEPNSRSLGNHGVVNYGDIPGARILRPDQDRRAAAVDEQVVVQIDVAFPLEQRLGRVLVHQVPIDLIQILCPRAGGREVSDQQVGAGVVARGRIVTLAQDVIANDRARGAFGQPGPPRSRVLVLDLNVVAARVEDQVALDDSGDEGLRTIGVAQVQSRAGAHDCVAADHPVPRGSLGGDRHVLLAGAVVNDPQVFQDDVAAFFSRVDGEGPVEVAAVQS